MSPSGVVYRVNNRRPRTDPCGTPVSIEIVDDEILPILTTLILAIKYDLITFNNLIPVVRSAALLLDMLHCSRISCPVVERAAM